MHTEIVYATIYKWNAANQGRDNRSARARAIEIHLDIWKKIRKNSQVKCRKPRDWDNRFPRACVVRIYLDINFMRKLSSQMLQTKDRDSEPAQSTCTWTSEKQLCKNVRTKCRRPISRKTRSADFARARAVEMLMDMSQKPFCAIIYRKKPANR